MPSLISRTTVASRVALAAIACLLGALAIPPISSAASRGYELVTPSDDGSYLPRGLAALPDGSGYYWETIGSTSGSGDPGGDDGGSNDAFLASRSTSGWTTELLTTAPGANTQVQFQPGMAARGLTYLTNVDQLPADHNSAFGPPSCCFDLYRQDDAGLAVLDTAPGGGTSAAGLGPVNGMQFQIFTPATPDLSAVAFESTDPLLPDDADSTNDVYLRRGDQLFLVSEDTSGAADNASGDAGLAYEVAQGTYDSFKANEGLNSLAPGGFPASQGGYPISTDGHFVVFQTAGSLDPADTDTAQDLYLWHDGVVSLISDGLLHHGDAVPPQCDNPPSDDCNSDVAFAGMAADASVIYLATSEELTADDTDNGQDIYAYRPSDGSLTLVTDGTSGSPDELPVSVSQDGSLFYITNGASPVLRRWDGGATQTIATLDPGDVGEGGLTSSIVNGRAVRATADGSTLAFVSYASLDPADTDGGQRDVYVWHAGGGVSLASRGANGAVPAILGSPTDAWYNAVTALGRGISTDGSKVFFTSAEALTPDAGDNGRDKVYEWDGGTLSLISPPGADAAAAEYLDNSGSGDDVFFQSADTLAGQDVDGGQVDVYDARVGGGFPAPTGSTVGASPSSGGPGQVPSGPGMGSLTPSPEMAPPANAPGDDHGTSPEQPSAVAPRVRLVGRGLDATGRRLTVHITVNRAGIMRAALRARIGRHMRTIASARRTFHRAAHHGSVRLRLTHRGMRALRYGTLRGSLRLSFAPSGGGHRVTRTYHVRVRSHHATSGKR